MPDNKVDKTIRLRALEIAVELSTKRTTVSNTLEGILSASDEIYTHLINTPKGNLLFDKIKE